jgi:hypothetical protein
LGGTTFGQVLNRGGLTVQVTKELNPAGVRVRVSGTTPAAQAEIEACTGPTTTIKLLNAGDDIVVTCGSATVQVISGPVVAEFGSLSADLPTGTTATIAELGPETFAVDNSSGSSTSISVGGLSVLPAQIVTVQDTNGDGLVDVASWSGSACDTSNPSGDPDGDGLTNAQEASISTNPCVKDTDSDRCADSEELGSNPALGGQRDPLDKWDFYDVPVPAVYTVCSSPGVCSPLPTKDRAIGISTDVVALLKYAGARNTGSDPRYNVDLDGNTVLDGLEYDRTTSSYPGQPWRSGPPDGGIGITTDVIAMLAQAGHSCAAPP